MKIKLSLKDLTEALAFASTVKPVNRDGQSAYLFTVSDGRCYIHSQDAQDYVRIEVPVSEIEEDASGDRTFVYPADRVEALKYLDGWIEISSGEEDGRFWTNYRTEGGAKANRSTFNPKIFNTMDAALSEAATEHVFPTVLLKEGISTTSHYLASNSTDPDSPMETVQLFDASNPDWAKGDGTFYAADGNRACYFHSPALKGKGLAVHGKHISHLTSFLNKCQESVKVKVGKTMTFVVDQVKAPDGTLRDGAVFGFVRHSKMHPKYRYHPSKYDKVHLMVPRDYVLKTLRHLKAELKDAKRDKIRVVYSKPYLKFLGSVNKEITESASVGVDPQPLEDGIESIDEFAVNVDVKALIGLFEASRDHNVGLRVAFIDNNKKAFFRTVSQGWIGDSGKSYTGPEDSKEPVYECLVTHFTTSMD